ncbi:MAG TPA: aldehyde-activating protein, partial [Rhizobiales bacterium]|nr:aldehyde-activating protein [Hyphomicrobiales bacterium]
GGVKNFVFTKGEDKLKWYESSDFARRGFCSECGSSLFWQAHKLDDHKDHIAIAAGCIDELGDNHISKHIFCAHKGDYYEIGEDGVPQLDTH